MMRGKQRGRDGYTHSLRCNVPRHCYVNTVHTRSVEHVLASCTHPAKNAGPRPGGPAAPLHAHTTAAGAGRHGGAIARQSLPAILRALILHWLRRCRRGAALKGARPPARLPARLPSQHQ